MVEIKKYTQTHILQHHECDKFGKIRLQSILNLFQIIADKHAEIMNIGYNFCVNNNLFWIIGGYATEILSSPKRYDEIEIVTWPSGEKKFYGIRDFIICDKNKKPLIKASGEFILMDLNSKRPVSIKEKSPQYSIIKERAFDTDFPKIPTPENIDYAKTTVASFDDIDVNQHVNNAVFLKWAVNSLPDEVLESKKISKFRVSYRKECKQNETVDVLVDLKEDSSIHIIKSGNTELAKVVFDFTQPK